MSARCGTAPFSRGVLIAPASATHRSRNRYSVHRPVRQMVVYNASQPNGLVNCAPGTFLGTSGMPMLGLGLAALGRPGYINLGHGADVDGATSVEELRSRCWAMLDAAWLLGVRYFDSARSYGRAEEFLAGWLAARQIRPGEVICGSKWGYTYTADWQVNTQGAPHEVKDLSLTNLRRQAEQTAGLLGDHLQLYQVHSATLESGVLGDQEVLEALTQLRSARGWKIGLSVTGTQQDDVLQKAMRVTTPGGDPLFDCVQATYNLLEQSAGDALADAHAAGLSVIIKEALANGRLTERNKSPKFQRNFALLAKTAEKYGSTVDALCLAAVLAQHQFGPLVLSGATAAPQLASNAQAVALSSQLGDADLEVLMALLRQDPQEYWAERSRLAWN